MTVILIKLLKPERLHVPSSSRNLSGGKMQRWLQDSALPFLSARDFYWEISQ